MIQLNELVPQLTELDQPTTASPGPTSWGHIGPDHIRPIYVYHKVKCQRKGDTQNTGKRK